MYGRIWKDNEPFDMTQKHDFTPTEEFRKKAIKLSQTTLIPNYPEKTEKMQKCKHHHWEFTPGIPSGIISCKECDYWEFWN